MSQRFIAFSIVFSGKYPKPEMNTNTKNNDLEQKKINLTKTKIIIKKKITNIKSRTKLSKI